MSSSVTPYVLVGGALLVFVLLLLVPRTPASVREEAKVSSTDLKIMEAVEWVQSGQEPMRGIAMLREVLVEDSTNIQAHWHLGHFAIQSGQYYKAIDRFQEVVRYDDANELSDVWFYMGRTYASIGDTTKAIQAFQTYLTYVQDSVIVNGVNRFIVELSEN
jgi:tetratricopeptide (TPR) repeat protein